MVKARRSETVRCAWTTVSSGLGVHGREGREWSEVVRRVRGVRDKCQGGTVGHPGRGLASADYCVTHRESHCILAKGVNLGKSQV